ncbi:MAG TPA: hypothetical protein VL404_05925, partial [Candidatus Eisenbacteria bacterium]|nr:hypothetical protein [Candidatus Eisenbacteria bacterium]
MMDQSGIRNGRNGAARGAALFAAAFALFLSLAPAAHAVQIKRVISGVENFVADDVSNSVSLGLAGADVVDDSKAFIYLTPASASNTADQNIFYYAYFEDGQNINISRGGGSATANVAWYVVEFNDGVNVQRGLTSIPKADYNKTITITSVDTTKAVPFVYCGMQATTRQDTETMTILPSFTDSTHLYMERKRSATDAGIAKTLLIGWQVVEFQTDVVVATGSGSLAAAATQAQPAISPNLTDYTKAFPVLYVSGGTAISGSDSELWARAVINSNSQYQINRKYGSGTANHDLFYRWYAVELKDGTSNVQVGSKNLATTVLTGTSTLGTAVTTARTVPFISIMGGDASTGTSSADDIITRCVLTNTTTLTFTRDTATSGLVNDINFAATEFTPLTIKTPSATGITLTVGETYAITWKHADSAAGHAWKLQISTDAPHATWTDMTTANGTGTCGDGTQDCTSTATSTTLTTDSVSWKVPDKIGTTVKLRLIDTTDGAAEAKRRDDTNNDFTIKRGLTVTAPTGSENPKWTVGDNTKKITWNYTGQTSWGNVNIYVSTNGGSSWGSAIATVAVNNGAPAGDTPPYAGKGEYTWTIGDVIDTDIKVKVESATDTSVSSTSPQFEIKRYLALTANNGGSTWESLKQYNITWNYRGGDATSTWGTVKLEFSTDGGTNWTPIAGVNPIATGQSKSLNGTAWSSGTPTTPGTGSYPWTVPNEAIGTTVRLRVVSESDTAALDASDADFTVIPAVRVDAPTAGSQVFYVGDAFNSPNGIQWTVSPSITKVDIAYTTDGGSNYTAISTQLPTGIAPSPANFAWTIPAAVSTTVKVRVRGNDGTTTYTDLSDNNFTIKAKVTSVNPSSGGYFVNQQVPIQWTPGGNLGNVRILLSGNNDFNTWSTVLNASVAGGNNGVTQTFQWDPQTVPNPNGITAAGVPGVYKIKVELIGDEANVNAVSSGSFKIKGVLDFSLPATGGADPTWLISHPAGYRIQWTKTPTSLGNVALSYSKNSGSSWTAISLTGTNQSNGYIDWVPPVAAMPASSANLNQFKVELVGYETDTNATSRTLNVRPVFTIINPIGSPFKVTENMLVDWKSEDEAGSPLAVDVGAMRIKYATDGVNYTGTAVDTNILTSSTSPDSSYTWTIPVAAQSNTLRLRIESANYADLFSNTTADAVAKAKVIVVAQNGGAPAWLVDSQHDIQWRYYGSPSQVRIFYAPDGNVGSPTWTEISGGPYSSIDGNGTLSSLVNWTVADAISSNAKIRVENSIDNTISDNSDAVFEIRGAFDFTTPPPASTPVLRVGGSYLVQWTNHGTFPVSNRNLKLRYSLDGSNYFDIDGSQPMTTKYAYGTQTYTWTNIPDAARGSTKLKIQWEGDTTNVIKTGNIAVKPSITLNSTNSGTFHIRDGMPIQFTHTGRSTDSFNIYYSKDNGSNWTIINGSPLTGINPNVAYDYLPNGGGTLPWTVPNVANIVGNQFKLKVEMIGDETDVQAVSSGTINIYGYLGFTQPDGTTWTAGDTSRNIVWTAEGITNIAIDYSVDNGTDGYAGSISGSATSGTFLWSPGGNGLPAAAVSDQVKVRIRAIDAFDNVTTAYSTSFIIKPKLVLTAPNGPTTRYVGDPLTISWTALGAGSIRIQYSTDADQVTPTWSDLPGYTNIDSGTVSSVDTTVPSNIVSQHVKFRVKNNTGNTNLQVSSASSTEFAVRSQLIMNPLSAVYTLRDTVNVTWTPGGSVGNVTVEYYNGATWSTVTTTAPEGGPYAFTLDSPVTTSASNGSKVRIVATNGTTDPVESALFIVKPYLVVTAPAAGNDDWTVDDAARDITWDVTGSNVANVKIEYAKDGTFDGDQVEITPSTANDGTFTWAPNVPDDMSATKSMKIRVLTLPTSESYAVTAISSGFKIKGQLAMVTPDDTAPVKWKIGTTNTITWDSVHGSIQNVKIYYSTAGDGGPWTIIRNAGGDILQVASGTPGQHSYGWAIPNDFPTVKDNFRLKVVDALDGNVSDASTAASSTVSKFTVTAPVAGNVWVAEHLHTILWSTAQAGVPATVKIEYNSGSGWQPLPETEGTPNDGIVANDGSQGWVLGVERTNAAKIRISDPADSDSIVESDPFKIRGDLVATNPVGGESWGVGINNADTHPLTWTKEGNIANVNLEITKDATVGSPVWEALVDGTTPAGQQTQNIDVSGSAHGPFTFNWVIPNVAGITTTKAKIRVVDQSDGTVLGESSGIFTIKGSVNLAAPNGGATYVVDDVVTVSGTVFGPIPSVRLWYTKNSTDHGLNEVAGGEVVSVSGGAFTRAWTIPDQIGTGIVVRVEDSANSTVQDTSNSGFNIKGSVIFTAPTTAGTTGSPFIANQAHNVVWNRKGSIGNIALYYDVNDSGTWT